MTSFFFPNGVDDRFDACLLRDKVKDWWGDVGHGPEDLIGMFGTINEDLVEMMDE